MMNGARFKLLVPKENCVIIFSLAGIRCPQTARNGSEAEPYADDAYAFARSQCFQREVDIETDTVDKNGAFFGRCTSAQEKHGWGKWVADARKHLVTFRRVGGQPFPSG